MADFNYVVDTEPMAESVDGVRHHIDATTAAVVAMQTATIIAEEAAAEEVCSRIDAGFHTLILSQISQKAARAKAIVDSKLQQLMQYGEFLKRLRSQMERDYFRIRGRYTQLFHALNATLTQLIAELDKDAYEIGHRQFDRLQRRAHTLGVLPIAHQTESVAGSQAVAMARARRASASVLQAMGNVVQKGMTLRRSLEAIMRAGPVEHPTEMLLPVLLIESADGPSEIPRRAVMATKPLHERRGELAQLQQRLLAGTWSQASATDRDRVRSLCAKLLAERAEQPRILAMAKKLLDQQSWDVIEAAN